MISYGFGFMAWLRWLITANKDYCGHRVELSQSIEGHPAMTATHSFIVTINGVEHKITISPINHDNKLIAKALRIVNGLDK